MDSLEPEGKRKWRLDQTATVWSVAWSGLIHCGPAGGGAVQEWEEGGGGQLYGGGVLREVAGQPCSQLQSASPQVLCPQTQHGNSQGLINGLMMYS